MKPDRHKRTRAGATDEVGGTGTRTALRLGRAQFTELGRALESEWLVTNGIGGFACGTVAQANTRRYHGLLVASLRPPLERVLMVAKVDARLRYGGSDWDLGCNEFADGTVSPRGFELLSAFGIELGTPTWTFQCGDALLRQRLWMSRGSNTCYVSYTLLSATQAAELELLPLCTYRDYHSHASGGWQLEVEPAPRSLTIRAFPGARAYAIAVDRGELVTGTDWYWGFKHRAESERGLDAYEDLYKPGSFRVRLVPGQMVTLTASAEQGTLEPGRSSLRRESLRRRALLRAVPASAPRWIHQLTLAADQFIVRRGGGDDNGSGTTVLA
ncbi:MAG: glycogen debranching enzyme N-terminal domain-containing protein, partial [Steroidobacteraceae bacterium]